MRQLKIIISGGGTGGHIFPAIAIANALKVQLPETEILFVGAKGRMEMEKVPAAGYKIEGLWISGLQRKLTLDNLSFPFKVISSLLKSRRIIKKFKPDVVVGVGGYASGPLLYAASTMGIPSLIQEQNSYPGITNKLLAKRVNKICVAYEGMERFFPKSKLILTGNPVRTDILNLNGKRERGMEFFNLNPDRPVVLVIGGSQGARSINESIAAAMDEIIENNIQVIWQTGKNYYSQVEVFMKNKYKEHFRIFDFIGKMDYAYAAADLVVSRAGASSVAEISQVKKPCILIPYPHAAEDHQTKNAMALVNHHAAIMIKDAEAGTNLKSHILELIKDKKKRERLEEQVSKLGFADSANVIASEIISLVKL